MLVMAATDDGRDTVRLEPVVGEGSTRARDDAAFEALYRDRHRDVHRLRPPSDR